MRKSTFLLVTGVAAGVWALGRSFPVRVVGSSMSPTLQPGDLVVATPARRLPRRGEIVVVRGPEGFEIVKRVRAIAGEPFEGLPVPDGMIAVAGDNEERSTDSRTWGPVLISDVAGVAKLVYWPPRRWRVVR